MIQLHVVSGAAAGKRHEASQFPVSVGRSPSCALALADPGVFDRHFEIHCSADGFSLAPCANAIVMLNGARPDGALLRNGDLISAGYAKIQFWLGALPQRGLKVRETLAWILILGVASAQAYLLFQLLTITRS